jgi:ABC-2 type transport system permease protein
LLKIRHLPEQLLDVTMFPVMFTVLFTFLFGGALAGSPTEYIQFLLPGIVVQTVVFMTMYTGMSLNTDITKGIFDRFRSLPIWRASALVGALLGDLVRFSIATVIIVMLGLVLGFRPEGGVIGVVLAIALVLLFAFCFSWIWTTLGLTLNNPMTVLSVSQTIMFPLTFISNIFVDPATMPDWLRVLVEANPLSRLTTATRGLMQGTLEAGDLISVLVSCVVLLAVFGPLTMYLYGRKR